MKIVSGLSIALLIAGTCVFPSVAGNPPQGPGDMAASAGGEGGETPLLAYACTWEQQGRVNLRRGPGEQYKIVNQIPNRVAVEPVDLTRGSDGFLWHQIIYYPNDYTAIVGWARGDFLCSSQR